MDRKLALVIGNSDYQDPGLARLKAPDADVRSLTELLRHPEIGQFDDVVPLVNASEAATRRAIASLFARANPDDLLLLYFSGHGVLDDQGRLYLAAHDTQRDLLQATAISTAFVTDAMDSSRSRRQVLILDCCHSGAFGRGARAATDAKALTEATFEGIGYGRAVLTATDATQYAWEGEAVIGSAENSVFTHFMIEGLRTGAADTDDDGKITLEELYTYIYGEVVKRTPRQTPRKWSYNQQGEFLIARNQHPRKPKLLPLPPDLQQSLEDPRPWVREGSVHELERLLSGGVPGLELAALDALTKLKDDDSHRVAQAALDVLQKYQAQRAASPARPPAPAGLPATAAPPLPSSPKPAPTVQPPLAARLAPPLSAQPRQPAAPETAAWPGLSPAAGLWLSIALTSLVWGVSHVIGAIVFSILWSIIGPLFPESVQPYLVGPAVTLVVGAALAGVLTGLILRRHLPALAFWQILLLAPAFGGAMALAWLVVAGFEIAAAGLNLEFSRQLVESLGLAAAGAVGGSAVAAVGGLLPGTGRARFGLLIIGAWALGLGLAYYLGFAVFESLDLGNLAVAMIVFAIVGGTAGLVGGSLTLWGLSRSR